MRWRNGNQTDWDTKLALDYIRSLQDFEIYAQVDGSYDHVGATLADAVLQSNNNYERNVRHRIARIRNIYASSTSLHDLNRLLQKITPQEFLDWNGTRKPRTFVNLVALLQGEGVDTEADIRRWLIQEGSSNKLLEIPFIGPKTVDYLKILVGLQAAAMDRHLFRFLKLAGISTNSYVQGQEIIHRAADLMSLSPASLDHSIWRHMSGSKAPIAKGP